MRLLWFQRFDLDSIGDVNKLTVAITICLSVKLIIKYNYIRFCSCIGNPNPVWTSVKISPMRFSTTAMASSVAQQGADSFGTSVAFTEKELIKIDMINKLDMIDFFILKHILHKRCSQKQFLLRCDLFAPQQKSKQIDHRL